MPNQSKRCHCEAQPKQSATSSARFEGLVLRPLRGFAVTAGLMVAPAAAMAHGGHGGGLGHLHAWDMGFAVLAVLGIGGIAYLGSRTLANRRKRRQ